jgi:hypothetical protein
MKQLLRNCCFTKLSGTVSHNFSFVGSGVVFNNRDWNNVFLRNVRSYLRFYTSWQPALGMGRYMPVYHIETSYSWISHRHLSICTIYPFPFFWRQILVSLLRSKLYRNLNFNFEHRWQPRTTSSSSQPWKSQFSAVRWSAKHCLYRTF